MPRLRHTHLFPSFYALPVPPPPLCVAHVAFFMLQFSDLVPYVAILKTFHVKKSKILYTCNRDPIAHSILAQKHTV